MYETIRKRIPGRVSIIAAGTLALSGCTPHEARQSTSVACTDITLHEDSSAPNTYDAVPHWQQEPGAEAELMRFSYYDGQLTELFPVSGVTGQEQILQLSPAENYTAFLSATIFDTDGAAAHCPVVPMSPPPTDFIITLR